MTAGAARYSPDAPILLEGELTIYTAAETYARLTAELEGRDHCALDLSAVSEMDGAGLQLLLWLKQTCEARDIELQLVAHSEAVAEVMALLHLVQSLGIASVPPTEGQPA